MVTLLSLVSLVANPSAIQQYKGLKHSDDQHDAFWLADMLRLNILPEGYIYPKQERPVRNLLRKRGHLVRLRTSLILSIQNIIERNWGIVVKSPFTKINRSLLLGKPCADLIKFGASREFTD